jgi:predicted RNase H-like HicB family nuclease
MNMGRGWKVFGKHRAPHEPPRFVLRYEVEREDDGRYLAEIIEIPGAMAYGNSESEAINAAAALALRVLAERIDHGEAPVEHGFAFAFQHV